MKISDILNTGEITVSCELFPPKHGSGFTGAQNIVRETANLRPSFISVTYSAGGGSSDQTADLRPKCKNTKYPRWPT